MTIPPRANEFLDKTFKLLGWLGTTQAEIEAHARYARLGEIERLLFGALSVICAAHEALLSAAGAAGLNDWRAQLEAQRQTDPLLKYLWKARDFSVHETLLRWNSDERLQLVVVDAERARPIAMQFNAVPPPAEEQLRRLVFHVYGVSSFEALMQCLDDGRHPPVEVLLNAGVEMSGFAQTLWLHPFEVRVAGRYETIEAPREHLGQALTPSVDQALGLASGFYRERCAALRALAADPTSGAGAAAEP